MTAVAPRTLAGNVSALGKAGLIIDAVHAGHSRLCDIAANAQLGTSTAHRILSELVDIGWVRQEGRGLYEPAGRRRLGPPTAREVAIAGQALHAWCTRRHMPGGSIDQLGPNGAARAALEALYQAGLL